MNPLAKATDESPVARGLSTRALFIRDAIFATVWYRPSRAPQTPPVHPCTGGSPYQDLNKNPKKVLIFSFGFDVDLFRHVVLQPKRGMKARIRRQGCRRKNGGARTNLPGANLNNACVGPEGVRRRDAPNTRDCRSFRKGRNDEIRVPAKQAEGRCQAGVSGGSDWPPDSDACTECMYISEY
jgi:hypothetical protein